MGALVCQSEFSFNTPLMFPFYLHSAAMCEVLHVNQSIPFHWCKQKLCCCSSEWSSAENNSQLLLKWTRESPLPHPPLGCPHLRLVSPANLIQTSSSPPPPVLDASLHSGHRVFWKAHIDTNLSCWHKNDQFMRFNSIHVSTVFYPEGTSPKSGANLSNAWLEISMSHEKHMCFDWGVNLSAYPWQGLSRERRKK